MWICEFWINFVRFSTAKSFWVAFYLGHTVLTQQGSCRPTNSIYKKFWVSRRFGFVGQYTEYLVVKNFWCFLPCFKYRVPCHAVVGYDLASNFFKISLKIFQNFIKIRSKFLHNFFKIPLLLLFIIFVEPVTQPSTSRFSIMALLQLLCNRRSRHSSWNSSTLD